MKTTIFITIPKSAFDDDYVTLSVDDAKELEQCLAVAKKAAESGAEDISIVITHKQRYCKYSNEFGPSLVEEI